jgi:hypothetical protein
LTSKRIQGEINVMSKKIKNNEQQGIAALLVILIGAIAILSIFALFNPTFRNKLFSFFSFKNVLGSTYPAANTAEPEVGSLAGPVTIGTDINASGGRYVQLGTPVISDGGQFQPNAPYHATFYYPYYRNQLTDGNWSFWDNNSNNPPKTWFSHYLPDPLTGSFDPAKELYSDNDYEAFKWQATKLAEAHQEVAIASWNGPTVTGDKNFDTILNEFMPKSDNPYPNLRWSMYYEEENDSNPSVDKIVSDLTYIKNNYANSPYYFKINNKPVLFVHNRNDVGSTNTSCTDTSDSSITHRWYRANARMSNSFYIVLQVFNGYTSVPCQPNSWHQYAPTTRQGQHGNYSYYVSPGFWTDDGSAEKLIRDSAAFETAVRSMVSSNATWKLTESWNKWNDGTQVAPGQRVKFNSTTGSEVLDTSVNQSYNYKNLYVDILERNLPALEAGTGR